MPFCDRHDPIHIAQAPVQVDRKEGLRLCGDRALHLLRKHVVVRSHVHEDRRCPAVDNRLDRRHKGVRYGDHLVSRPDTGAQ